MPSDQHRWISGRWWLGIWGTWACLCAAIIQVHDRSLPGSLAWLVGGLIWATLGQRMAEGMFGLALRLGKRWAGGNSTETLVFALLEAHEDGEGLLDEMAAQQAVGLLKGGRDWREDLPMMLLVTMGAGSMYGLFLGCLLGTVSPWVDDWPGTSLRGALVWGSIMTLMLAVGSAVTLAVMTWKDRRGPAVRGLQPIVRAAIRQARNRCDDRVRPGHLLLALLDDANELTGLLPDAPRQAAWRHLDDLLPTFFPSGDDEDRFLDTEPIHDSLTTAVDEARRLKHRAVETGHVLLALLDQWPEEAARTLAIAGLAPATQRDQILDWLRRSLP